MCTQEITIYLFFINLEKQEAHYKYHQTLNHRKPNEYNTA